MTRRPSYPPVDPRRTQALRQTLLRDVASMASFWRGAQEDTGADRALIEAAARLQEEATKRLDKMPERDALAFLDMFDIAPPQPVAAEGLTAFVLKEDRTRPVDVPARTGIEIKMENDKAPFETMVPLRAQPGRISLLASVDPGSDRIEIAPASVTALEPDLSPRPEYRLLTGAPADSKVVAIEPVVGLAAGDLLRVDFTEADGRAPGFHEIFEIAEDGRVTLTEPIGGSGLAPSAIKSLTRQTAFDAFAMPNRQEHGFYLGDGDALNVKEPAKFTLAFDPPEVAADLIGGGARFELFGTAESMSPPEDTPRWHELVPLAAPGDDLVLYKAWTGPVDEVELGALKSRFIRIVAPGAISADAGALMASPSELREVRIGVKTEPSEEADGDTISQVAHNGQPLSVADAFLPFGAEPLRFDVFSLAAPEAFTKPNAEAVLDFDLADATMLAVTQAVRADGDRHVYGVSRNGRLQVMDLTDVPVFREIEGPAEDAGAGGLDPTAGIMAQGAFAQSVGISSDYVLARTPTGLWQFTRIRFSRNVADQSDTRVSQVGEWAPLPALPATALAVDPDNVPEQPAIALSATLNGFIYETEVYAATSVGLYKTEIDAAGNVAEGWTQVDLAPDITGFEAPLSPILTRIEDTQFLANDLVAGFDRLGFLTVDTNQELWLVQPNEANAADRMFNLGISVASTARPAGIFHDRGGQLAVAAADGNTLTHQSFSYPVLVPGPSTSLSSIPNQSSVSFLPDMTPNHPPHVIVYAPSTGSGEIVEWAPDTAPSLQARMAVSAGISIEAGQAAIALMAVFPHREGDADYDEAHARVIIAGEDRTAFTLELNTAVEVNLYSSWIAVEQDPAGLPDLPMIAVLQVDTASEAAVLTNLEAVGERVDGSDVVRLPATTDMGFGAIAYRIEDISEERAGDLDLVSFELSDPGGVNLNLDPGDLIIVSVGALNPEFRIFQVDNVLMPDAVVLRGPDNPLPGMPPVVIDTLSLGGTTPVGWRRAEERGRVLPSDAAEHRNTLVEFADSVPAFAGPFHRPNVLAKTEALDNTPDGEPRAILLDWTGQPPFGARMKIAAAETEFQALTATPIAQGYSGPQLSWEYYNGEGWKQLTEGFADTTQNLARNGSIRFTVPRDLSLVEIGGQEDYWIRARLIGGDYGRPKYIVETNGNEQTITVDTSHMRPPEVVQLVASFTLGPVHFPTHLIARNNLQDIDVTGANGLAGATITMFRGADALPLTPAPTIDRPVPGTAILVGFSQPLTTGTVSLLLDVEDQDPGSTLKVDILGPEAVWSPAPLTGEDVTRGLSRSGLVSFQVATPPAQFQLLGQPLHWVRMTTPDAGFAPKINSLYLNGVPVIQATTIEQELVGASSGEPNQEFQLRSTPVLTGSLELRVRERLGEEEVAALRAAQGDGPDPVLGAVPNLPGQWVLWRLVDSLAGQGGDRVFRVDAEGRVRFGNGRDGRLLPAGRDNLRAFRYRAGGQRIVTSAFAAAAATATVEALDLILAPIAISGGRDLPEVPELISRMPDVLRRATTALTLSDIEAAARDADNEIAQVRAFAPRAMRDRVLVAVLARGDRRLTTYSHAARENLARVLARSMSDAWGSECLDVVSVDFVELQVDVTLVAKPDRQAELEAEVGMLLGGFLDPARGGPDGSGWPPGRPLWPTDIRRALMTLDALDCIGSIKITAKDGRDPSWIGPAEVIAAAAQRDIRVQVQEAAL